jgi:sialate O-acetylesterase
MKIWLPEAEKMVKDGKLPTTMPVAPGGNNTHQFPTMIFNAMVNPIIKYGIKGVIWYQGESNGGEGVSYKNKMNALISDWRNLWQQGDFPFYFVQLANYRTSNPNNPAGGDGWAKLREAQLNTLSVVPNTGMAVIIDIGEANDIHPKDKQDVGKRLAAWALKKDYNKDVVLSGPLFKDCKIEGSKAIISFDHTGSGLTAGIKNGIEPFKETPDAKLKWIAIAGADKKWHWADAVIDGNKLIVSSDKVKNPVAVRYAFTMNPQGANLYNKEGFPASPFRTDNW